MDIFFIVICCTVCRQKKVFSQSRTKIKDERFFHLMIVAGIGSCSIFINESRRGRFGAEGMDETRVVIDKADGDLNNSGVSSFTATVS